MRVRARTWKGGSVYCSHRFKDILDQKSVCDLCGAKCMDGYYGVRHPRWAGRKVGYNSLHSWVRSRKPKPAVCEQCKIVSPMELANVSGKYKRDVRDFELLCRKCHRVQDMRRRHHKKVKVLDDWKKKFKGKLWVVQIPLSLRKRMKAHPEVVWSEIAREGIIKQLDALG